MAPFTCRNTLEDVRVWNCDVSKPCLHVPFWVQMWSRLWQVTRQKTSTRNRCAECFVWGLKSGRKRGVLKLTSWLFRMNVAAAVLFDVPPSRLKDCVWAVHSVLLTPHCSTRWNWCLLTVVTVTLLLERTLDRGERERERSCCNKGLELVALCFPSSEGSLKCHL